MQFSLRALWLLFIGIAVWLGLSARFPITTACLSSLAFHVWCFYATVDGWRRRGWKRFFWVGSSVILPLHLLLGGAYLVFGMSNLVGSLSQAEDTFSLLLALLSISLGGVFLMLLCGGVGVLFWGYTRILAASDEK